MNELVELRVSTLLADQAYKIVSELDWIERRLMQLGDSDEDRVEAIVLKALQKHLLRELREITWVVPGPGRVDSGITAPAGGGTVVKA